MAASKRRSEEGGPSEVVVPVPDTALKPAEEGSDRFPIVGIGASAGGLAAFEAFFSGMPAERDPGMPSARNARRNSIPNTSWTRRSRRQAAQ